MSAYIVYEPPDPPADRLDRAESLVFIKDGFSWGAALFGPLWFLAKRLWLPALALMVLSAVLAIGLQVFGLSRLTNVVFIALGLIVGFEASALQRWSLERRGWSFAGTVVGRGFAECERRFFEAWLPGEPVITSRPQGPTHGTMASTAAAASAPRRLGRLLGAKA